MKKQFFSFILILFLVSCLEEQNNPLVVASCSDKIKNQNEEAVDCGGICYPCEKGALPAVVPCKSELVKNRITIDGVDLDLLSDNFWCSKESAGDLKIIIVHPAFEQIEITMYDFKSPPHTTALPIVQRPDHEEGKASIVLTNFLQFIVTHGDLYVTMEGNSLVVEFCSLKLLGHDGKEYGFSGKIICP